MHSVIEVRIEQLERGENSVAVLCRLLHELDANYIPSISTATDIPSYAVKLVDHAEVFIATHKDANLGLVAVYTNDEEHQCAYISSIGVRKEFHGLGIGTLLLNIAFEAARKKGMKRMRLEVNHDNSAALKMYRRSGFSEYSSSEDGQGGVSIKMEMDLR